MKYTARSVPADMITLLSRPDEQVCKERICQPRSFCFPRNKCMSHMRQELTVLTGRKVCCRGWVKNAGVLMSVKCVTMFYVAYLHASRRSSAISNGNIHHEARYFCQLV